MPKKLRTNNTVRNPDVVEATPRRLRDIPYIKDRWGCSRAHVYRQIKSGRLKPTKISHLTRFTDAAIAAAEVEL